RQDKAKTNILKISELGLVEMTRKRTRENLVQLLCEPCPYCEGRSYVLSRTSVAQKVLREIKKDLPRFCGRRVAIAVSPRVAEVLFGAEREALAELEAELGRQVEVRAVPGMHQEQFELIALDAGPPVEIALSWLSTEEIAPAPKVALAGELISAPAPVALDGVVEEEQKPSLPVPMLPFSADALEDFSPLDLGPEVADAGTHQPVDEAPGFRILPRPEQGEES
ncbi:MAG: hypothetical protein NTZ61_16605, partial [Proteobacteria bacterium]|nr:hypothetical protein [Pseudomonadota bacterium]